MEQDDLDMGLEDLVDYETNSNDASSNDLLQQISGGGMYKTKTEPKISLSPKEIKPSTSGKGSAGPAVNTSGYSSLFYDINRLQIFRRAVFFEILKFPTFFMHCKSIINLKLKTNKFVNF